MARLAAGGGAGVGDTGDSGSESSSSKAPGMDLPREARPDVGRDALGTL